METMKLATLLLLLLPLSMQGQRNVSGIDGSAWKPLTTEMKLLLLAGYMQGYNAGGGDMLSVWLVREHISADKIGRTEPPLDPTGVPLGQVITGTDECYKDFRNLRLPLQDCIDWTVAGVRGETEAKRSLILENGRRLQSMVDEEERSKR
jgi:hypothetical protein